MRSEEMARITAGGLAETAAGAMVGFSLLVGLPKLRRSGRSTLTVRSLEEGLGGTAVFLSPNAPRGPADQLQTPELLEEKL